ncbi:G protein-activated inward rectifier potassium channel 3-like [Acanthaster planci]|uniref:G protein-activated inward rectifier potassium channel 3-like n=1 Tax=Acanthaster planci TaxID=133434 RepID=A0A8B7YIW0_ACAPL|nr:G protein-activated inward rectifier potassium channel 3-like [Acanthaster planci]XP_022092548.1 G protein-activated inward rectifier potassium channel 3-like [Acanthaster planci]XP_022092549.1 G protein-activated inward rectifier potassium channel 3-like [Acanthaster planci]
MATESLNTSYASTCNCNHTDMRVLVANNYHPVSNHVSPNHISIGNISNSTSSSQMMKRRTRLVEKDGRCNIQYENMSKGRWCKIIKDIFTSTVDMPWRYNILMVVVGFLASWLLFAAIYYGIALGRGDLDHLYDPEWKPCFRHFENFKSALLYSIEAQTTIGFGYRSPTEQCGEVLFFLILHTLWANFIEAFIIGSFIAKVSRPKARAKTLQFSHYACMTKLDGKMCFTFRVGDLRQNSHIVEGHMRLQMVRHYLTQEGNVIPYKFLDLNIGHEIGIDRLFLVWPLQIVHVIDDKSPLYSISRDHLRHMDFEIIAILEGIVEATGTTTQARTSYLPDEIMWGFHFENMVDVREDCHFVDMKRFHMMRELEDFSRCSAKEIDEMKEAEDREVDRDSVWTSRRNSGIIRRSSPILRDEDNIESRI